jgi:protein SCO1/2
VVRAGIGALALVLVGLAGWWWLLTSRSGSVHGFELDTPREVPAVTLQGSDGRPHSLRDFQGKVVLLYFGYTTCPDVCPMTLGKYTRVKALLGDRATDVRVVMVTVDPQRDTPDRLREYLAGYGDDFLGLTGNEASIRELASGFGVYFATYSSESALGYLVEHSTSSFLLDREGRLRIVAPYELSVEQLAQDVQYLLRNG